MLLLRLDNSVATPKYRQIMDQIIGMIDSDVLKIGSQLPSSRSLSERLGINRSTVYKAYQELWALGYIDSQPGSYSYIRKRVAIQSQQTTRMESIINWDQVVTLDSKDLSDAYYQMIGTPSADNAIDFTPLSADPRLLPTEDFRKCFNKVLKDGGAKMLLYGNPLGNEQLRQFIVDRMGIHCISAATDEVMLTNGAQQAIELILKLLVTGDQSIIVEEPTYSSAIPLFRFYSRQLIGIPMRKNGMDLSQLENAIQQKPPALIYTMPNFQNPMGITTDQEHREKLLKICEKYRVPLIEDGFEEEMKYYGKAVLPIKSMDRHHLVFYVGTFSKALFPGLRIGWITADKECIRKLVALKAASDISGNQANQAALNLFCRMGYYDLHIKRIHRVYRKRMQTALKMINTVFPDDQFTCTAPAGGYTFWVEMKHPVADEKEILRVIREAGAAVSPGSIFFPNGSNRVCFRLSIAHRNEKEIKEGLERIKTALRETC
ncbi:PLP-dependent aminotransferase family protein [bacterium]|nr:PLP-dependent aminotransferase family protein [bacterium]